MYGRKLKIEHSIHAYMGTNLVDDGRPVQQKKPLHYSWPMILDQWTIYQPPWVTASSVDPWAGPSNTEMFHPVWDCMASWLWYPEGIKDHMCINKVLEVCHLACSMKRREVIMSSTNHSLPGSLSL